MRSLPLFLRLAIVLLAGTALLGAADGGVATTWDRNGGVATMGDDYGFTPDTMAIA